MESTQRNVESLSKKALGEKESPEPKTVIHHENCSTMIQKINNG